MISSTSARISAEIARQSQLSQDIAQLQVQVSTGQRLMGPSDDPAAAARIAAIRRAQDNDATYSANITVASAMATRVDAALGSVFTSLTQARELVIQGNSDTLSDDDRATIAQQLRGIADDIASALGQKDSRGQPLFPDGAALAVPVADGRTITPNASLQDVANVSVGGGTQSLADILSAAADALSNTDPAARQAGGAAALDAIGAASDHVADQQAGVGIREDQLNQLASTGADDKVDLANERDGLQATDMSSAIATIQQKLTTLQAAQAVFAKVNQQSLFSLLG